MKRGWVSVLAPLLFWLLLWEGAALLVDARAAMGGELLLPTPVRVLEVFFAQLSEAWVWKTALASLTRMFGGILIGALGGLLLGLLTAGSRICDLLFSPAVKVVRAVPVASFILLVLLWVDRSWVPVVISALMVLPVIWSAVRQGVAGVDPQLLELSRCYRLSRGRVGKLVWLPALKPPFTAGLATAMGLAWKAGVAAEVLCQPKWAIGSEIYRSKWELATPRLFAWTLLVVLLSLGMEKLVNRLLKGGEKACSD